MIKKKLLLLTAFLNLTLFSNAQWQNTNGPANGNVFSLATNGTDIFAGTDNGVFLYGNNWTSTGFISGRVTSIVISGVDIFAAGWIDSGVYLSTDNGNNWTSTYNGIPINMQGLPNMNSLAVDGSYILVGTGIGLYKTNDNGSNYSAAGLSSKDVRSVTVSGNNIFAGTYGEGVFLSADNGNNWTTINIGLTDSIIYSLAINGTSIFAGTNNRVFFSNNNGSSWSATNSSLPNGNVYSIVISGSTVFAGTSNGVYFSTDNGNNWTAANTGLTNTTILSLTINGTYIFAGTDGGGVWKRPLGEMISVNLNEITPEVSDFIIYPNPSKGEFILRDCIMNNINSISVLNIFGEKIYEFQNISNNNFQIDLSKYSDGIYFLKINIENKLLMKKILIQK